MEKRKGNGLGTTQREYNDWELHKGNAMIGETQREWNGWGNIKGMEWVRKHKGNTMDGETERE